MLAENWVSKNKETHFHSSDNKKLNKDNVHCITHSKTREKNLMNAIVDYKLSFRQTIFWKKP